MSQPLRSRRYGRHMTRVQVPSLLLWALVALWSMGIFWGYALSSESFKTAEEDFTLQRSTLRTWDRIYRMNAALSSQPPWLQFLLGHESLSELRTQVREELQQLNQRQQLDLHGQSILAALVLESEQSLEKHEKRRWEKQLDAERKRLLAEHELPLTDLHGWQKSVVAGVMMPWEEEWLLAKMTQQNSTSFAKIEAVVQQRQMKLFWRYTLSSAVFALCFWWGICYVPRWTKIIWQQRKASLAWPKHAYASQISLSLMLVLLIVLEWSNEILLEFWQLLSAHWAESWWWQMMTDTVWRSLPVLIILVICYRSKLSIRRSFGLHQRPAWSWILALYALLMILDWGWNGLLEWWDVEVDMVTLDPMEDGWWGLVYGLISACLMAPLAEEFFYRGFLFRSLQPRCGFWCAALLSSTVFAVAHFYDLYGTVSVAFCGMATAWLYATTRSLVSSILLHALYNISITIPSWLLFHAPL